MKGKKVLPHVKQAVAAYGSGNVVEQYVHEQFRPLHWLPSLSDCFQIFSVQHNGTEYIVLCRIMNYILF